MKVLFYPTCFFRSTLNVPVFIYLISNLYLRHVYKPCYITFLIRHVVFLLEDLFSIANFSTKHTIRIITDNIFYYNLLENNLIFSLFPDFFHKEYNREPCQKKHR